MANEAQWTQHMKDKHGLNSVMAARDHRKKQIDRWFKDSKIENDGADNMEESEQPAQLFQVTCEICKAPASAPMDFHALGMSFQCSFLGRVCTTAATCPSAHQPPVLTQQTFNARATLPHGQVPVIGGQANTLFAPAVQAAVPAAAAPPVVPPTGQAQFMVGQANTLFAAPTAADQQHQMALAMAVPSDDDEDL